MVQKIKLFAIMTFFGCLLMMPKVSLAAYGEGECEGVYKMHQRATDDHYGTRASARFVDGVVNIGLGWTQLIIEPIRSVTKEDENILTGVADGFASSISQTVGGVWDFATFWLPGEGGKELAVKDNVACHLGS